MSLLEHESPSVDVFISYAREDLGFVRPLSDALQAGGRSVWIDLAGLYAGEAWWPTLCQAIDAAHVVLFVLSPDSAASGACRAELEYADGHGKRIVPLAWRDPGAEPLHPVVQRTQWLLSELHADVEAVARAVVAVLDSDPEWLRGHTRWLQRALDWDRRGRPEAALLRGEHLEEARRWLAGATPARQPEPVVEQRALVAASDRAEWLQQARTCLAGGRYEAGFAHLLRVAGDDPDALGVAGHTLLFEILQGVRRCEPLRATGHGTDRLSMDLTGRLVVAGDVWRATAWDLGTRPAHPIAALDAFQTDAPVVSPTGERIVTGAGRDLVLRRPAGGDPIATIDVDEDASAIARFSPDGRWLAVGDGSRLRLLSSADGTVAHELDHGRTVGLAAADFDPEGAGVLARSPERLRLWAIDTGQLLWEIAAGTRSSFWSARFSTSGEWIVAARGNRRVAVWRSGDGAPVATLTGPDGDEYRDAWFIDGDRGLVAFDGLYLRSWSWPGKGQGRQIGDRSLFAVAPAGSRVALSSGDRSGRITLRDTRTGELVDTLGRHAGSVTALAWTPDGEHLVSGDEHGLIVLWAMATRSVHATVDPGAGPVGRLAALPDGTGVVATCGDGTVRVWRFDASLATRASETLRSVAVSSRAGIAVAIPRGEGTGATVRDGDAGQVRAPFSPGTASLRTCAFSPDGRWLAALDQEDRVHLADAATLAPVSTWPAPEGAVRLSFSGGGGRLMASGGECCAVWDLERKALVFAAGSDRSGVATAALSPDGRRLCMAEVGYAITAVARTAVAYGARIVEIDADRTVAPIAWGDDPSWHRYSGLSFAPDGSTILLVREVDGQAALVDVASGACLRTFGDDASRTAFAAWTPDGRAVLTAGGEGVVVWNAADGVPIARLTDQANVRSVVFSGDGALAATVGSHAVWVWDCESWAPLANLFDGLDRFPESATFTATGERLIVVESDGQTASYPVGRRALCADARQWAAAPTSRGAAPG